MLEQKVFRLEYPRPDFEREIWENLNGEWDFEFDDKDEGERNRWFEKSNFSKKINVPFCYQSKLSGIGDISKHRVVWYKRSFLLPNTFLGKQVLINFGAVDYEAKVWLNGEYIGKHRGGHVSFNFNITGALKDGTNEIIIRVEDDDYDCTQPRGKQSWKENNFGCWYTRTTGIWQPVWLEPVEEIYIERVKLTPDIDNRQIEIEVFPKGNVNKAVLETVISFEGLIVKTQSLRIENTIIRFCVDIVSNEPQFKVNYWTPETPNLYDIKFTLKKDNVVKDEVRSYFGMRKISSRNGKILLNNMEYYQKLILDQGYYGDGLLTAASDELFKSDINAIKDMGFNGLRIHQKVEDPRFLYWCDKIGLLVWGEIPSTYEFNDTAVNNVAYELLEAVKQQYNHPSIIIWTLMNESWGVYEIASNIKQQNFANALYSFVTAFDTSRLLVGNDGWEHTTTDILTIHDYSPSGEVFKKRYKDKEEIVNGAPSIVYPKFNFAQGYSYSNQPIIISEFGGIAFNSPEAWGFIANITEEEEFFKIFKGLIHEIMDIDYVCGFCYTQLTDVEQEMNGLMDFHHKLKFDVQKIKEVMNYLRY